MSLRGRINQQVQDWREQRASKVVSILQRAINKNRGLPAKPDTSDGVDLAVIIIACWLACFVAGIVYGRL